MSNASTSKETNMTRRPAMTYAIAHAASWDAGNASMKKAGRSKWSKADYSAAAREFNRLMPEGK